jgi:hypothetical protein
MIMRIIIIMNIKGKCKTEPLAVGRDCRVELCSCGTINLHLAEVTIRLTKESYYDLWGTLSLSAQNIMAAK